MGIDPILALPGAKHNEMAVTMTSVTEMARDARLHPASARRTIVSCALAVFLAGYGGSILFVALPGIATEFGANVSSLRWPGW